MGNRMVDTPTPILGAGGDLPSALRTFSPVGASEVSFFESGRLLEDGSWDAWSFGSFDPMTFAHEAPPTQSPLAAAPVPEPSVTGFLGLLCFLSTLRRKR